MDNDYLEKIVENQHVILKQLTDLNVSSEKRIDRTNEMVMKMANVVDHITDEYSKHLDSLSLCRDQLLHQNEMLLKMHEQDLAEIRACRDKVFDILGHNMSRGGVKVENRFDER